jgi:hypothetical protein
MNDELNLCPLPEGGDRRSLQNTLCILMYFHNFCFNNGQYPNRTHNAEL